MEIKKWLLENRELDYKEFSARLAVSKYEMLGVRLPKLRKKAKELNDEMGLDGLECLSDETFEEVMLQGFLIASSDELIELKEYFIYEYLLKCDNWSLVDSFASSFKFKGIEREIFFEILKHWQKDENDFVKRFVTVSYLKYLDDEHIDEIFEFIKQAKAESYQLKMAISWLLATAYINYQNEVLEIIDKLDDDIFKYTKQKIRDSYRISTEDKEKFKR